MKNIGTIVLSFEEAGELAGLLPWKNVDRTVYSQLFAKNPCLSGLILLSTCNRVELIYSLKDSARHTDFALSVMETMPRLRDGIRPAFLQRKEAVRHLIRLATGLESLVLGETEIKAQIKNALDDSEKENALDSRLRVLFRNIFHEAKVIRTNIPVNYLPLSLATLAVKKIQSRVNDPDGIVIIGSGPMSRQAAEYLTKYSQNLILVNRTVDKIEGHAKRIGARVLSFEEFLNNPESLGKIRAIITATSRQDAFITPEFVQKLERSASLFLVDLALPPDVDPACSEIEGTHVISMETLREELELNRQKRSQAAAGADTLIHDAVYRIQAAMITGLSGPVLKKIQKNVREKSRAHLDTLLDGRLAHLNSKDKRLLYNWAIQANRELNRIHRQGLETVLKYYYIPESISTAEDAAQN